LYSIRVKKLQLLQILTYLLNGRLVTCASDCEQLQRENSVLERRLDDEHQRVVECERREQEAIRRVRDTLQLVDAAQIDKDEVGSRERDQKV